ncbi:VanZ family protein [Paenibacillus polysaccharolyticus]|uniref:VanZ family protein n=1 Tax=Paenibacillus polysaccharolyticus TaxID=582692 RepID=UPI00203E97F7|nr:VanZ family protein [Paenibacillus polysaccharolyticus]MCM3135346.1 VanZ family protein [Paenibacillus polysaccharolyticus]
MTMRGGSGPQRYKQTRRTYGWWIALLLVVIWIVIIWSMSAQSYQQQNIQPWLHRLSQKVHIGFTLPDVHFTYSGHEYSLKQRPYDFVEFLFRKTAHLLVYAILAVLIYGSLRYKRVRVITCVALALMFVVIIASIDEYIQQFSPNRTSSIWDVGVDLIGGCCGIAIYIGIRALLGRRHH